MGHWKDLPYEVLLIIGELFDTSSGTWKNANKQLYNLDLINRFKVLEVQMHNEDDDVMEIYNSVFEPGKYVKTLEVYNMYAPQNIYNFDRSSDMLCKLIARCPNVEELSFDSSREWQTEQVWAYLATAILESENWKLKRLEAPTANQQVLATSYFNIAYYMRNSLLNLTLAAGAIGIRDYARLAEYKKLEELAVWGKALRNIFDCDSILKYVPRVTRLTLSGTFNLNGVDNDNAKINTAVLDREYDRIKSLCISQYVPSTDEELLYIMKKFTRLTEIDIYGELADISWPPASITQSVFSSYLEFAHKIGEYSIKIGSKSGEDWLMNAYYSIQENLQLTDCKHFTIGFKPRDPTFDGKAPSKFSFKIYSRNNVWSRPGEPNSGLSLLYSSYNEFLPKVKNNLMHLNDNVESLRIKSNRNNEVFEYIEAVLTHPKETLKELEIKSGFLIDYFTEPNNTSDKAQFIKTLVLTEIQVSYGALQMMSYDFKNLNTFKLSNCTFKNNFIAPLDGEDDVPVGPNLNMDTTSVDTVILDELRALDVDDSDLTMTILLCVTSKDQNFTKCYLFAASGEQGVEIGEQTFGTLYRNLDRRETIDIYLNFKSINNVIIKTKENRFGRKREISLSF